MNKILVVCEGNICRSPMAAGILSAALPNRSILSAGLSALIGMPADPIAVRLMRARGIDISSHRGSQLNSEMCKHADLVLVMSSGQRKEVEHAYPTACGRVFRIGDFIKRDIPDPYRQEEQGFRSALELIDDGVRGWLSRLQRI
jgi:protein-tyrosine phosphatase